MKTKNPPQLGPTLWLLLDYGRLPVTQVTTSFTQPYLTRLLTVTVLYPCNLLDPNQLYYKHPRSNRSRHFIKVSVGPLQCVGQRVRHAFLTKATGWPYSLAVTDTSQNEKRNLPADQQVNTPAQDPKQWPRQCWLQSHFLLKVACLNWHKQLLPFWPTD